MKDKANKLDNDVKIYDLKGNLLRTEKRSLKMAVPKYRRGMVGNSKVQTEDTEED